MRTIFRRSLITTALLAALGGSPLANAIPVVTGSPIDTITELRISWSWDMTGGTSALFQGTFWETKITTSFADSDWTVTSEYRHLNGPHDEGPEPSFHVHTFGPMIGALNVSGIDDHEVAQHIGAHSWSVSGDLSMGSGGTATLNVTHPVPEPAAWILMFAGLGVVGGLSIRSKHRH